jgi:hypothetical protein
MVMVWVTINFSETELRKQVMNNRAKWLAEIKVWQLTYAKAKNLG